ncbi:cytochrome c oxidase assembly protein PET191-domain-containing protein [Protomyces lactucae-debilis]|uniref:Cytochrome c oxidase assembly protein PET191-domain-containing protein n=1 Tax=Protomyces lactucae-debilis TaxID=2754530 RepID=A0A1Y2FWP6_PROLT|nr:cytochrome c oxidase assembly protein PET191-domain-containing protein [Protomyces lactucae-debilis]ORY87095.1 cytochrome c oxidase assembly protein PET191-domain-containing protein [Protomyces lactucae-debilis]
MPSSCRDIRDAIATCLFESECVKAGHPGNECLSNPELRAQVPEQCLLLLKNFYDCKRGLLDMRKRFRGNAPISQRPPTVVEDLNDATGSGAEAQDVPVDPALAQLNPATLPTVGQGSDLDDENDLEDVAGDGDNALHDAEKNHDGFYDVDAAEEFLVTLDLGATPVDLSRDYKLLGLDTETPFLLVDGQVFTGYWSTSLGTEMVFDRVSGEHQCNVVKRIVFRPAKLRKAAEEAENGGKSLRTQMLRRAPDGTVDTLENLRKQKEIDAVTGKRPVYTQQKQEAGASPERVPAAVEKSATQENGTTPRAAQDQDDDVEMADAE